MILKNKYSAEIECLLRLGFFRGRLKPFSNQYRLTEMRRDWIAEMLETEETDFIFYKHNLN